MSITEKEIRSAASPGERRTLENLRDTEQGAVRSIEFDCACVTHTRDDGTKSTFVHTGAPKGHTPTGKTTDVTRSAHSRQKAVRNAPERPKTVTRGKSAPLTPAEALSVAQSEIRRLNAKGDDKTLTEVRYIKTLRARVAALNAEERVRGDAEVKVAAEKMRARRAQSHTTINVTQNNTAAELRNAALRMLDGE